MNTAVVLSDSLGGILTLVAFMGILGVYFVSKRLRRREVFWNWMGTLLVLSGLLGTLFLLGYSEKNARATDNPWVREAGTASVRICLWQGTYRLLKDNWLTGVGLSGFKESYAQFYATCDAEPLEYPHNFTMTIWAELGLLGLISFYWILISIALSSQKVFSPLIRWGIVLFLTAIVTHGLVDIPYFKNDLSLIFWVIASFLV